VLAGEIPVGQAPRAVQSWAQFFIYQGAEEVLTFENVDERRAALGKLPALVRPLVEAEVRRLWEWRRSPSTHPPASPSAPP